MNVHDSEEFTIFSACFLIIAMEVAIRNVEDDVNEYEKHDWTYQVNIVCRLEHTNWQSWRLVVVELLKGSVVKLVRDNVDAFR